MRFDNKCDQFVNKQKTLEWKKLNIQHNTKHNREDDFIVSNSSFFSQLNPFFFALRAYDDAFALFWYQRNNSSSQHIETSSDENKFTNVDDDV